MILTLGCGYRAKGRQSALPGDVRSLAIPVLENRTNEPGLEAEAARIIIEEFNRRQELEVVPVDRADAVLKGVLARIHTSALAYTAGRHASQRRVNLWTDFQLTRAGSGEVLWRIHDMSFQEGYAVTQDDPVVTDTAKRAALRKILRNLAEKLHEHLFTAF